MLLIGPTRSGKGTIARVLTALLGPHNVCGPTLASFAQNFGLQTLIGKPLAIVSDARLSTKTDQATVVERLLSISGEDSLDIDRKYRDQWHGKLPTRLMILSNELPRLTESSGALVARFLVLQTTRKFLGNENENLTDELLVELPGILLWAIEGWRRRRARTGRRFVQPESGKQLLNELSELASPVSVFVEEHCIVDRTHRVYIEDLYQAWRKWCYSTGRREPGNPHTFGRDLRAVVPSIQTVQVRADGDRRRAYDGIGLRSAPAQSG